jgi:hypothetical protein
MQQDDSLRSIYDFVERACVRLQAGEVLNRCLDDNHSQPVQSWVEGLVISGPQNIGILQEILAEVGRRKTQIDQDINQVINHFEASLNNQGVHLLGLEKNKLPYKFVPKNFLNLLTEKGVSDKETRLECLRILHDAHELLTSLFEHLRLLEEIETYLKDWLWGMAYHTAHQKQYELLGNFLII